MAEAGVKVKLNMNGIMAKVQKKFMGRKYRDQAIKKAENHFNKKHNLTPKSKVAIYYLNTNNGHTVFKNKKVKSEKNKIVIFNGDVEHKAEYQTDKDTRMVINFNYE